MMYPILFSTTAFIIMSVLLYKLNEVVKKFDDIIGGKDA